jgi:hypothetical protein
MNGYGGDVSKRSLIMAVIVLLAIGSAHAQDFVQTWRWMPPTDNDPGSCIGKRCDKHCFNVNCRMGDCPCVTEHLCICDRIETDAWGNKIPGPHLHLVPQEPVICDKWCAYGTLHKAGTDE